MVVAGIRLAANIALVTAIAVEMIAAGDGLGARVWLSWQVLRTEQLYSTLTVIALAGIGLNALLIRLEGWLVPWRPASSMRA
jgi:ABC-type nitrate/sulfonate/bicarbonate transport system permease component